MKYALLAFYLLASAGNLLACKKGNKAGECLTKPLLMPLLLAVYLIYAKTPSPEAALALVCGFFGDVLLLLPAEFFTAGLSAFLAGHLFYTAAFLKSVDFSTISPLLSLFLLPYLLYAAHFYRGISRDLKKDRIPVLLYLSCIIAMSFSSFLRITTFGGPEFWLPFTGSLFFIASDSLLALKTYKGVTKGGGAAVMSTYIAAQTMIIAGLSI